MKDTFDKPPQFATDGQEVRKPRIPKDFFEYYALLGVPETASAAEIRKAFLELSQRYHTDKHANQDEKTINIMMERFKQIQQAYLILSDERQRAVYDTAGKSFDKYFQLIPKEVALRDEIRQFVRYLEHKEEILQLDSMFSSSSNMSISYNLLPITMRSRSRSSSSGAVDPSGTAGMDSTAEIIEKAPLVSTPTLSHEAAVKRLAEKLLVKEIQALELAINNEKRIAIILKPSDLDSLESLKLRILNPSNRKPSNILEPVPLTRAMLAAAFPTNFSFTNSFKHIITPRLETVFEASANSSNKASNCGLKVITEFKESGINSYKITSDITLGGATLEFRKKQMLSPIWTLVTDICIFSKTFLRQYSIHLTRRLSNFTELETRLLMSFVDPGAFSVSYRREEANLASELRTDVGSQSLSLAFLCHKKFLMKPPSDSEFLDEPEGLENKDSCVSTYYIINFDSYSCKLTAYFEANYSITKHRSIGIGFSSHCFFSYTTRVPFIESRSNQLSSFQTLTLKYKNGNNNIQVPVSVFRSPLLTQGLIWISVPIMFYRVGTILYAKRSRNRDNTYYIKKRKEHIAEVDIAKEMAIHEQRALENSVILSRLKEEKNGGLVIFNAVYGVLEPTIFDSAEKQGTLPGETALESGKGKLIGKIWSSFRSLFASSKPKPKNSIFKGKSSKPSSPVTSSDILDFSLTIDVTLALQNLVHDSKLALPPGTKASLAGFCDPDPHTPEKKQLKIMYRFQDVMHSVTFDDLDPVMLPLKEHVISKKSI